MLSIPTVDLHRQYFSCYLSHHITACHWEAFHTCALTALSDCQQEVSSIWETLRQDSRKMRFQGSLFDLCSPSSSPSMRSPVAALTLPLTAMLLTTGPRWSFM
uniref:Neuritin 1-like b n=1 Tax=Hippocampus comes TaxID=109280 RepID=A0A3Q2Z4S1_HIPCM